MIRFVIMRNKAVLCLASLISLSGLAGCSSDQYTPADCGNRDPLREGQWSVMEQPWDDIVVESAELDQGVLSIRYATVGGCQYVVRFEVTEN